MNKWLYNKSLTVGVAYGNEIPTTDFVISNYDILEAQRGAASPRAMGHHRAG
jgi:hypothetical protein